MTATNDSGQGPLPPLSGESKAQTIRTYKGSGFLVANPKFKGWGWEVELRSMYIPKKAEKAGKE